MERVPQRAQTVIYGTGSLLSRRAERTQIKEEENMKKAISMAMAAALALSAGATTVPVMADDVTELTIWSPTDTEAIEAWWEEKLAEWNKENPDIQVKREAIDRSDSYAYDNKIATAQTSNDLPDIFKIRLTEQFQFIIKRSKPICPELDLSERLLTRNIQLSLIHI